AGRATQARCWQVGRTAQMRRAEESGRIVTVESSWVGSRRRIGEIESIARTACAGAGRHRNADQASHRRPRNNPAIASGENMSAVGKALWFIESNFGGPLSLDDAGEGGRHLPLPPVAQLRAGDRPLLQCLLASAPAATLRRRPRSWSRS